MKTLDQLIENKSCRDPNEYCELISYCYPQCLKEGNSDEVIFKRITEESIFGKTPEVERVLLNRKEKVVCRDAFSRRMYSSLKSNSSNSQKKVVSTIKGYQL